MHTNHSIPDSISRLQRVIKSSIGKYDIYFTAAVAQLPPGLYTYFSTLGRMTLPSIWAAALVIVCLAVAALGYSEFATLGAVVIACIPIGTVLKLVIRRERPDTPYAKRMKIKSYSFPSSHTYSATIACGFLALLALLLLPLSLGVIVTIVLAVFAASIGISRIYLGAHYPSDVTAGWILGGVTLYLVTQLML